MSEELQLSRRGLLQMVGAVVLTASFAARRPLFEPIDETEETPTSTDDDDAPLTAAHSGGTKLECFLRSRGIKPAHLARESGYSRQHLLRVRLGRIVPTPHCIAHLVAACRRLAREPVHTADLFDLRPVDARAIDRMQRRLLDPHR